MKHIMVDLETLGTQSTSVILSIGAVAFDIESGKKGETFYRNISINSCLKYGLTIDGDTVEWWLKQGEDAIKSLTENKVSLYNALDDFKKYYFNQDKGAYIWGNGATFDNVILSNAYEMISNKYPTLKRPWHYTKDADMRTIAMLVKHRLTTKDINRVGTYHNALDDAKFQVDFVSKAYQTLQKGL